MLEAIIKKKFKYAFDADSMRWSKKYIFHLVRAGLDGYRQIQIVAGKFGFFYQDLSGEKTES